MSRSAKKERPPGYEWWGKRPCKLKNGGVVPGPKEKKLTHRAERRAGKKDTKDIE